MQNKFPISLDRNFIFFICFLPLVLLVKYLYSNADTSDLLFILYPINVLIELLTGSESSFKEGYIFENFNIIIDKSCSGINFWLVSSTLSLYLLLPYYKCFRWKLFTYFLAPFLCFFYTIIVNTSRILSSIMSASFTITAKLSFFHLSLGIFIYFSALVILSLVLVKLKPRYLDQRS